MSQEITKADVGQNFEGSQMLKVELKTAPEIKAIVLAAFPNYRKHSAFLSVFYPLSINSYWDGGSRSEFSIVELDSMRRRMLPNSSHPYFDIAVHGLADHEDTCLESDSRGNITLKVLPEGFALVEAGCFCGKPATAHVFLNKANLAKLLLGGRDAKQSNHDGGKDGLQ